MEQKEKSYLEKLVNETFFQIRKIRRNKIYPKSEAESNKLNGYFTEIISNEIRINAISVRLN